MFEVAGDFEQLAMRFSPLLLIGAGLVIALVGLFIWLGGAGFSKLLVALIGAGSGSICGFFVIGRNIKAAVIFAATAAALAMFFERIFVTAMVSLLAAVLTFGVLAGPGNSATTTKHQHNQPGQRELSSRAGQLNAEQSFEIAKSYAAQFAERARNSWLQMGVYQWAIMAISAAICIFLGIFFSRLALALCCATLGTVLIFGGMILLLLYKGSTPVSAILQKQFFYMAVFAAMVAFGAVEQLLLCRYQKKRLAVRTKTTKGGQSAGEKLLDWRNR